MSDFWTKPQSLRDLADDISSALPDDEIGGAPDTAPNPPPGPDAPTDEITITGNVLTDDAPTNQYIKTLHPAIRNDAARFINAVKDQTGVQLRIPATSAFRTTQEQNKLFTDGDPVSGKPVTNAPGGQSYHNYGLGFDVVKMNGTEPVYQWDFPGVAQIGREHGFDWGGDWKNPDLSHFQRTYGYTTNQLQQMVGPDSKYPVIPADRLRGSP